MQFSVNIEEIREKGLDYDRELPAAFLQESLGSDGDMTFQVLGPGRFHGRFTKLTGRVLLDGHIEVKVKAPCKRCLTDVSFATPIDFTMTWVPERPDVGHALQREIDESRDQEGEQHKASFDLKETDTEVYDGETIPLDGMIREQILLNLPMDVVCQAACKGLCSVCGQDLNVRDCGHVQKVPDPRWAALKDIKLPN